MIGPLNVLTSLPFPVPEAAVIGGEFTACETSVRELLHGEPAVYRTSRTAFHRGVQVGTGQGGHSDRQAARAHLQRTGAWWPRPACDPYLTTVLIG